MISVSRGSALCRLSSNKAVERVIKLLTNAQHKDEDMYRAANCENNFTIL